MARGVAMLAKKTGVPVVPAGIVGTKPKRRGVVVAYGKPFTYAELATGKNERENREILRNSSIICAEQVSAGSSTAMRW